MLVFLAGAHDRAAARTVESLKRCDAALVTPADLSQPGWTLRLPHGGGGTAFIGGGRRAVEEVRGVFVRIDAVSAAELIWVHRDDREYVAAEMTAFLSAWLAGLGVPVLNAPRGVSLCGPGWRPERWLIEARCAGIPIQPLVSGTGADRSCPPSDDKPARSVATLLGDVVVGGEDGEAAAVRRLARRAGCEMLRAHFEDGRLSSVDTWVDLDDPAVARATAAWAATL